MGLYTRELLNKQQRQEIKHIPYHITEEQMSNYYSFSQTDIEIINRHRRDHNRLGFAVQLCVIRFPGWPLSEMDNIPRFVLDYIADQIKVSPDVFQLYAERETTKREHVDEIRNIFEYKNFSTKDYHNLSQYLLPYALENNNSIYLIKLTLDNLRSNKIIFPAISTIEKIVWEVLENAEEKIYKFITDSLSTEQKKNLDNILTLKQEESRLTILGWLRESHGNHSPETFLNIVKKVEYLKKLNIEIDLKYIHPNRLRQLVRLGTSYEPISFKKMNEKKRYSILVIYLLDLMQDLVDQAISIHDKQMNSLLSSGKKKQEEILKDNGKSLNEKIIQYSNLVKTLVKARSENLDPYQAIETSVMKWDDLINSAKEADDLSRPINFDYLDLLTKRFNYLRKYTPVLLEHFRFNSNKSTKSLIDAINLIKEMNKNNKRVISEDAPVDFISDRWIKYLYNSDGKINRQYYELAMLVELKNSICSGNISVSGSKKYKDFDDYLINKEQWEKKEPDIISCLPVSFSYNDYIKERMNTLNQKLEEVSKNFDNISKLSIENDKIHLNKLEKDTPLEAKEFSKKLYSLLPRTKLTDLLLEVSNWTNFTDQFTHASSYHKPKEGDKLILLTTLMAMGTNVGLTKMAEATTGISYYQMANASQWRMYEMALNKAQSSLVNFHHSLNLPYHWGNGTTSSSDGMFVQIGASSLTSESNAHYSGKGTTIYRFVSDQYSSFYVKTVNTNTHDSIHIVDGLLHHETDLNIEEHYTDTAGYTNQVFGLLHLLGFKFAPRLRDLKDSRLYTFDKASKYQKIEKILDGKINTKIIEENYDDVLRLTASIKKGTVSGSLIMGKLGSYSRKNSLANALSEMGKIEKTIFILEYISNESFRHRIQKGLNKGEATHALARAISFGKHGELFERSLKDQLQRASALNIIINAINVWNTVYLEKAVKHLREKKLLREDLLCYISSMDWEHINFLGDYNFSLKNTTSIDNLRPLNI